MNCTLVIPYYRNPLMLRRQLEEIAKYPPEWRVTIVDDGSPEPAEPIVREWDHERLRRTGHFWPQTRLYRIDVDIPWNREGARNLASQQCETDWLVHVDIDHILPADCAARLTFGKWDIPSEIAIHEWAPLPNYFYRFARYRVGAADDTRMKDRLPREQQFGAIHPHVDSYLCTKDAYWKAGGYNEKMYSGILGGGGEFLRRLEKHGARAAIAPTDIHLHVYTRDAVPDASDLYCSRDMAAVRAADREVRRLGNPRPGPDDIFRFPWHRVL